LSQETESILDPIEKLTIETPEQIELEFPLAGVGSRALALLFDSLIQFGAGLVIFIVVAIIEPDLSTHWVAASNWVIALEVFGGFCLYWGYFTLFEALWNGQTPGKRHAKIRVLSDSGRPITVFEAIARNFLRVVDSLGLYFVGCIAIAIDKRNRRLGDMVAGTVVVHEVEQQSEQYWYAGERTGAPGIGQAVTALTMAEFQLIEAFLNRRLDLPLGRRQQAAQEIADRIGARLEVPPASRPSAETFLEEVARLFRDHSRYH
jgi:uncharacterized RDD family membrane protein YckC